MTTTAHVEMTVNGERHSRDVETRTLLVGFLRGPFPGGQYPGLTGPTGRSDGARPPRRPWGPLRREQVKDVSPEETALSIMAEVVAVRNGRDGGRLSHKRGGRIHEVGA